MTLPLFEVRNLSKYFPVYSGVFRQCTSWVKAVDDISFHIDKGEILAMVGESGCGKSTAARASIGLIPATQGEVLFKGKNLFEMKKKQIQALRREIQIIFQDPYAALNPRKSIVDNIGEALLYHQVVKNKIQRDDYVVDTLEQVGLSADALNRYPHEFSGGQQQRICIARAIALKPSLIICDEAVSALDVSIQAQVLNLLYELKEKFSLSYLFISHDLSVVRHFCDRLLVLYYGKVVEQGAVHAIFSRPSHPYTQKLIAAIPRERPLGHR